MLHSFIADYRKSSGLYFSSHCLYFLKKRKIQILINQLQRFLVLVSNKSLGTYKIVSIFSKISLKKYIFLLKKKIENYILYKTCHFLLAQNLIQYITN